MARPSDTKQRILEVARELFTSQGVTKTSLQDIADRLGITKPALYYHFSSREDLVRTILQPLVDGGQEFIERHEATPTGPRELLERYFDFQYSHRAATQLVLSDMALLAELNLIEVVLTWRDRLVKLLIGPEPSQADAIRAIVAIGGLQDCAVLFDHVPEAELRETAVTAAMGALRA